MFQDRPILGFGFGNFPEEKLAYLDLRKSDLNMDLIRPLIHHNTYLDLLVELGLVGFVLYMGVLIGWGRTAWRLIRQEQLPHWMRYQGILTLGALGSYMIQMLFHEVTFTSVDNSLMFLLAGISSGLAARPQVGLEFIMPQNAESVTGAWFAAPTIPIERPSYSSNSVT